MNIQKPPQCTCTAGLTLFQSFQTFLFQLTQLLSTLEIISLLDRAGMKELTGNRGIEAPPPHSLTCANEVWTLDYAMRRPLK